MKDFWELFKNTEIAVLVENTNEVEEFMELCEREGMLWNDGKKPTHLPIFCLGNSTEIIAYTIQGQTKLKWKNFCAMSSSTSIFNRVEHRLKLKQLKYPELKFEFKDNRTTARLMCGAFEFSKGVARCHPNDQFNLADGIKLATERALQPYEDVKFKNRVEVGDRIIKSVDKTQDIYKVVGYGKGGSAMYVEKDRGFAFLIGNFQDFEFVDKPNEYYVGVIKTRKEPKKQENPKRQFKVGDTVRFKTWEQLEAEFGVDYYGDINCRPSFTNRMEYLCGSYAVIVNILENGKVILSNAPSIWLYSTDMLELVEPDDDDMKWVTCKAVHVGGLEPEFEKGKVYDFVNGKTIDRNGAYRPFGYLVDNENAPWFKEYFVKLVEEESND